MCTVTWQLLDDGYELLANRDEQRTRLPARPPTLQRLGDVRVVAPVDGDAGGTWIGANENGLALCLLNGRQRRGEEPPGGFTSRGLLVRDLLPLSSVEAVASAFRTSSLELFRGFRLLAFEPGRPPWVLAWDGRAVSIEPAGDPPWVSSSKDPVAARESRRPAYDRLVLSPGVTTERLLAYHRSHDPERGPVSVCMHREDARTVSASHLRVESDVISFAYAPGPPCCTAFEEPLVMPRVTVRAG